MGKIINILNNPIYNSTPVPKTSGSFDIKTNEVFNKLYTAQEYSALEQANMVSDDNNNTVSDYNQIADLSMAGTISDDVETTKTYVCSMHPEVISDKPGLCTKCGMELIEKK